MKDKNNGFLKSFIKITKAVDHDSLIATCIILNLLGMAFMLFISNTKLEKQFDFLSVLASFGLLAGVFAGIIMPCSYVMNHSLLTALPIKSEYIPASMSASLDLMFAAMFITDIPLFAAAGELRGCPADLMGLCIMYIFACITMNMIVSPGMRANVSQNSPKWLIIILPLIFVAAGFAIRNLSTFGVSIFNEHTLPVCIADVVLLAVSAVIRVFVRNRISDKMFLKKVYKVKKAKKSVSEESYI